MIRGGLREMGRGIKEGRWRMKRRMIKNLLGMPFKKFIAGKPKKSLNRGGQIGKGPLEIIGINNKFLPEIFNELSVMVFSFLQLAHQLFLLACISPDNLD